MSDADEDVRLAALYASMRVNVFNDVAAVVAADRRSVGARAQARRGEPRRDARRRRGGRPVALTSPATESDRGRASRSGCGARQDRRPGWQGRGAERARTTRISSCATQPTSRCGASSAVALRAHGRLRVARLATLWIERRAARSSCLPILAPEGRSGSVCVMDLDHDEPVMFLRPQRCRQPWRALVLALGRWLWPAAHATTDQPRATFYERRIGPVLQGSCATSPTRSGCHVAADDAATRSAT